MSIAALPAERAVPRRLDAAAGVVMSSLALVVMIVGIFIALCLQGIDATTQTTRTRAQNAADIVAESTRWLVTAARATLDQVAVAANAAGGPDAVASGSLPGAGPVAAPFRLEMLPAAAVEAAVGASDPRSAGGAVPELLARLAAGETWGMTGQQVDPVTGEPAFAVGRRLGGTRFLGVGLIWIPARQMTDLSRPQELGQGSTISIVRVDGWVVARAPSLAAPLNLAGTPAFADLQAGPSGSYVSGASPADGVARVVGFRHVDELGYVAVAAISMRAAFDPLWQAIWIVSLLIAPIALAVLGGSLITARVLRRTAATSQSLAVALERNEALFQEIHHRVKNNLQSVTALLRLHPIPAALRDEMSNRIFAMSAVHEHIYRSRNFSTVSVKDYVQTLVDNLRDSNRPDVALEVDIDDIAVHRDVATPLGLIVNEVVANSFKHAFPGGREGTVHLSLKREPDGRARLTIRDDGVGFDPEQPSTGIGKRLVKRFAAQLEAEMQHTGSGGTSFTLVFPVEPTVTGVGPSPS